MKTMTFEELRGTLNEAHGDKNDRGWRKNQNPNNKKRQVREDDEELEVSDEAETGDEAETKDDEEPVKIVTFKTTDAFLVDMLQGAVNGITISTTDDVQTFGPDSFDDIEVNDWSEDDVEDDDEDEEPEDNEPEGDDSDEELEVKED